MQIMVSDRKSVESGISLRKPYIVISIRNPGTRKPAIPKSTMCRGVLHLAFHDAEPVNTMKLPAKVRLMTTEHAAEIWTFVQGRPKEVEAILVHCEQGASRSPAVAAAICRTLGGDDRRFFCNYTPNLHVFQLTMASGQQSHTAMDVDQSSEKGTSDA
jgi:predicted protein tyrosine phosphatase